MALRLGIGDTVTLCKGAIDLCSRGFHEEPDDARIIIADMCLMRSHLQFLSHQMGDEKEFVASRPDIAPAIHSSLAPIHKDLSEMKELMHERNSKRKPSLHIVDRVRFHVLYKAKLDGFREKMPAHRKSLSEMETLIDAETHTERRASILRLGSLTEEHEEIRMRDEEIQGGKRELLQIFEEHVGSAGDCVSADEVLHHLEQDLVVKGTEKEELDEHMESIRNAMMFRLEPQGQLRTQGPEAVQLEGFKF